MSRLSLTHSASNFTTAIWVGLIELTNSVATTMFGWSPTSLSVSPVELTSVSFSLFHPFFSLRNRHIWFLVDCCTVSAFTLLKYFQPTTRSTIRHQVFKAFRLELAQGMIGNYNSRQCYALPPVLHDAAHKFSLAPAKRRNECGTTDGIAPDRGHFP